MIAQEDKEISELQKSTREDKRIANDENEHPSERERARERITEKREHIDALENEREKLEEGASLIIQIIKNWLTLIHGGP